MRRSDFVHPSGDEPATEAGAYVTGPYVDLSDDQLTVTIDRLERSNERTLAAVRERLDRLSERNHVLADLRAEKQKRRYA